MALTFAKGCGVGKEYQQQQPQQQQQQRQKRKRKNGPGVEGVGKVFEKKKRVEGKVFEKKNEEKVVVTRPVVGTSSALEKAYRRGEGNVDPENVRPLEVLKKSFESLIEKVEGKTVSYVYFKDQIKSLRQDLLVQHVRNEFTWRVYRYALKESLREKDLDEVTQCLAQLKGLRDIAQGEEKMVVLGYILVFACLRGDVMAVQNEIAGLSPACWKDKNVKYALEIVTAVSACDHYTLREHVLKAPRELVHLIRLFLPALRESILSRTFSAYHTLSPVDVAAQLLLPSPTSSISLLKAYGVTLPDPIEPETRIPCKPALAELDKHHDEKINPQFEDLKGSRKSGSTSPVPKGW